jgi:hypothetical protein
VEHLGIQLLPSFAGKGVKLGFTPRVRVFPLGVEPAAFFQTVQGGIERALENLKEIAGDLLNALRDGLAVNGAGGGDFKDEHIESSLEERDFFWRHVQHLVVLPV